MADGVTDDRTAFDWLSDHAVQSVTCPRCKKDMSLPLRELPCGNDGVDFWGCDAELFCLFGTYEDGPGAQSYFNCKEPKWLTQ